MPLTHKPTVRSLSTARSHHQSHPRTCLYQAVLDFTFTWLCKLLLAFENETRETSFAYDRGSDSTLEVTESIMDKLLEWAKSLPEELVRTNDSAHHVLNMQ